MRALLCVIFAILASFAMGLVAAKKHRRVKLPTHVEKVLAHNDATHLRFYPDFKFEGFGTAVHPEQPARNMHRSGTGPHDVMHIDERRQMIMATTENVTKSPFVANASKPYPDNLKWLLGIFETGYGLPRSYNDILPNGEVYWATQTYLSVGAFDEFGNHTSLDSEIAIQERTLTRFGLNLYDAATWEIALALFDLHQVAYVYESNILYEGTTGAGPPQQGLPGGIADIRADDSDFKYGNQNITGNALKTITYPGNATHFHTKAGMPSAKPTKTGPGSFFYRMIGPKYTMVDPMLGPYGASWKYPWPDDDDTTKWNVYGIIHFNDWKPITGENVWGTMLGPIQAAALAYNNNLTAAVCGSQFKIPHLPCDWKKYDTTPASVQLGITIIPALLALQDPSGALFHCPWGSKIFPPDNQEGFDVSNENCFSAHASIYVLEMTLYNYTKKYSSSDMQLKWALDSATKLRKGLDKWFENPLILTKPGEIGHHDDRFIPQGGHINASGYVPVPLDVKGGLAIDCQTWGMTVMTREKVDKLGGAGTCYKIWQGVKKWAGYFVNDTIAGVGYTDKLSKKNSTPEHKNTIWSAEWTFGAINMAQVIGTSYIEAGQSQYGDSMIKDAQDMLDLVTETWPKGLQFPDGSYVYANKRFFIPWGWFSNPIPATCSTAWSVMQMRNYNPFYFGGYGRGKPLKTPPNWRPKDHTTLPPGYLGI